MEPNEIIIQLENYIYDFIVALMDKKKKSLLLKHKIIETTRLIYIIEIILRNLKQNTHTTLRQVFYTNPKLFVSQNVSNRIIGKVTQIIKRPRESLNIYNSPKGIIRGNIFLKENNSKQWVNCLDVFETRGHLICPFGIANMIIPEDVKFVLIIEKETIFFQLLDIKFIEIYGPCILMTAKGFPDINTKRLLYEIHKKNRNLKIFCLTDYDAYGLTIAITYTSKTESKVYYVDDMDINNILWLDLFTPDQAIEQNIIKRIDLSPLTLKDIRILDSICVRLKKEKQMKVDERNRWVGYAHAMKKYGVKYEIDSIVNIEKHIYRRIKEYM